ncbi:MAG: acetate/propionate family kinase, partial [Gemmatimonadales bacterium]
VAFKAVHGGPRYQGTFYVDDDVMMALEEYLPAAPAHNAIYLTGIRAFREAMPGVPLIAAFETEFHATMPDYAARYGVPREWHDRYGIRRYGFHGASHRYVAERTAEFLGRPIDTLRLVSCHLGGSSSICAIDRGQSVDTSMGFSPASGLVMGTRAGDVDPGLVAFLARTEHMTATQFERMASHESGLLGVSETSSDMRALLAREATDVRAAEAVALFCYHAKKWVGAFAAALGGLDTFVFAGGIGENAPAVRARICEGLGFLGVELDAEANRRNEAVISTIAARVTVRVIRTDEEMMIARSVYRLLGAPR